MEGGTDSWLLELRKSKLDIAIFVSDMLQWSCSLQAGRKRV